jgi:uncharacterized protein
MKYFLLVIIKLYWLIPAKHRRECLFKESCSKYVYRITSEQGFLEGMKSLKKRINQCSGGYATFKIENQEMVLLKDKTIVPRDQTTI